MSTVDWDALARVLESHHEVVAAWVFGSARDGTLRPGGDLDIAVLCKAVPGIDGQADLCAELQEALEIDPIDLVVLNAASPLLRFEALSGKLVLNRDPSTVAGFASLTAREYEDEMAFLEKGVRIWGEATGTRAGHSQ